MTNDDGMITEPVGRTAVRFIGFKNPSKFLERTLINRDEAGEKLVGHKIDLVIPPELQGFVDGPLRNPKGKVKEMFDDPYLHISPKIQVPYRTKEYRDKKTGEIKTWMKKGKLFSGEARDKVFPLEDSAFFSKTSKMSAPSFSLPAGPKSSGGSCAAADINERARPYKIALTQGDVEQTPAREKDWICKMCYAGKSNYMHRTSQYTQTARWIWLNGILEAHQIDGAAHIVAGALAAHLGNAKVRESMKESSDFFRIHDSGDLVPETYLMWRLIAVDPRVAHVKFWCPTRAWVFPVFNQTVRANPPPDNFVLRPSALHFGDKAPMLTEWGYAAGSTAHPKIMDPVEAGTADWNCPAYNHDGKSCAGGGGPKGEKDCRFCWTYKDQSVSYKAH